MPDITALSEDLLTRIARLVDIDAMEEVISAGDARTAAAADDDDGGAGSETRAAGAEPASPPSSSSALRLRRDATEFERLISRMYKQKVASRFFQAQQSTDAPTDASAPLLAGGPGGAADEPADGRESDVVWRCAVCSLPFSARHANVLTCPRANLIVDYHGNAHCRHVPRARRADASGAGPDADGAPADADARRPGRRRQHPQPRGQQQRLYDTGDYVAHLRRAGKDWRGIYWHLWGLVTHLKCLRCGEVFPMRNLSQCRYHSVNAHFQVGESKGRYLCCGRVANRFNYTSSMCVPAAASERAAGNLYARGINVIPAGTGSHNFREDGCCTRDHAVRAADVDAGEELRAPMPSAAQEAAAERLLETYRKHVGLIREDAGGLPAEQQSDECPGDAYLAHPMHGGGADLLPMAGHAAGRPGDPWIVDDASESECDSSEDGSYASSSDQACEVQVPDSPPGGAASRSPSKSRDKRARLARLDAMRDADEASLLLLSLSLRGQREPLKPVMAAAAPNVQQQQQQQQQRKAPAAIRPKRPSSKGGRR